jgi:hypothetical protein
LQFPGDYDGIAAFAPSMNKTHESAGFNWNYGAFNGTANITAARATAVTASVVKQCVGKDGGLSSRCVSLGSDAGIEALLKAKTWKQAAWALVVLIGAHYGTQAIDTAVPVVAPIARSFVEGVINPRPAEYPRFRDNLQLHRDIENPGHPLPPPVILRG